MRGECGSWSRMTEGSFSRPAQITSMDDATVIFEMKDLVIQFYQLFSMKKVFLMYFLSSLIKLPALMGSPPSPAPTLLLQLFEG